MYKSILVSLAMLSSVASAKSVDVYISKVKKRLHKSKHSYIDLRETMLTF